MAEHRPDKAIVLDSGVLLLTATTFLVAGFVKGVIGLGMPTIAVALLSTGMGLPAALQILVVPTLVTNAWQALARAGLARLARRFATLIATTLLGVWIGYAVLFRTYPREMTALLGALIVLYGTGSLLRLQLLPPIRRERLASPVIGATTGILAGATGNLSMPALAYFNRLGLPRDDLVQLLGILFSLSAAALGIAVAGHGDYDTELLAVSCLAVVPGIAGMLLGQRLRGRLSEATFKRALFWGLLMLGGQLVWRGLV